uniref:H/ACA ribonucleoprotein complex subunit 2 n=1 Tax=Sus scrofa TaxID=9823 RepID=A0A8D0NL72_PIG
MTKIKADPNRPEAQTEACCGEHAYHELLTGKLYKCIKKAIKQKQIQHGVKEVQKFIDKGKKGIMVLAGDTLPVEVYCHLPVMCEDRNLPYIYIPSKTNLGAAAGSKRPTCVIMVKSHKDYQEAYDECLEEVQALLALAA